MYPPKKPVGGKTFPQGREILQVFKNWGGGKHIHNTKSNQNPQSQNSTTNNRSSNNFYLGRVKI